VSDRFQPAPLWPAALTNDPDWRIAVEMGVDVTLLEESFRMSPAERMRQLAAMDAFFVKVHGAAWRR
jgi:hypothetical protein